jgi:drug/metabolite transporter (DMT)-like permease
MVNYLLLGASTTLGATKSLLTKLVKEENETFVQTFKKNIFAFLIGFVIVSLFGISQWQNLKNAPFLLSFLYALFSVLAQLSFVIAVTVGPCSISTLFYSCGFIIPTLWGSIYYKEGVSPLVIAGLCLVLFMFVLLTKKDKDGKISFLWACTALSGFLCSGLVGVIQKLFVKENPDVSLQLFLIPAFAFIVILGFFTLLILQAVTKSHTQAQTEAHTVATTKKPVLYLILTIALGITFGCAHTVNTFLAGTFPSYVSFPVINGGTIILTTVFSVLFLKERLTKKQFFGIVTGIIAIILISVG